MFTRQVEYQVNFHSRYQELALSLIFNLGYGGDFKMKYFGLHPLWMILFQSIGLDMV